MTAPKIAILGNMNNNANNLVRFLTDEGLDCTVLFFSNEAQHFDPTADNIDEAKYRSARLDWGSYKDYFTKSPKELNRSLSQYDFIIGSRLAPSYLAKAGRKLHIFMPTGGDLHTLPFFNTWSARDLLKFVAFSRIQRRGIERAECLYWDDTSPRIEEMIKPFTGNMERIRHAIPCIYYPEFEGGQLERRRTQSPWLAAFREAKRSTDILFFHHVKHVWTREAIRKYGAFHAKGNDQVIRGLAMYQRARPSVDVKIAMFQYGDDHLNTKRLAEELGVADRIIWFPQLPRREIMLGIAESDAVIGEVTNSWFSYGTIFEALAMGKPVLHHRQDSLYPRKVLYPMINIADADGIRSALEDIASGSMDLKVLGAGGNRWLRTHGIGAGVRAIVDKIRSAS